MELVTKKEIEEERKICDEADLIWAKSDKLYNPPRSHHLVLLEAIYSIQNIVNHIEWYMNYRKNTKGSFKSDSFSSGMVLINGRYIYSYSGKWRIKGRNKWYRSKNIKDFVSKYVKPKFKVRVRG